MKSQLITKNIWQKISSVAKRSKTSSYIAVGYFGQGGSKMLPLSRGSVVVVDASENAVKSGQTCPAELLELYNRGAKIYSSPNLHAKVYVLGSNLFIGSANVSGRSRDVLTEVMLSTNDRNSIREAKEFVKSLCSIELGPERLKALQEIYRPPRIAGGKRKVIKRLESSKDVHAGLYNLNLCTGPRTKEENRQADIGREQASKKVIDKVRHKMTDFLWTLGYTAKEGDTVIQMTEERGIVYVSPPGTIIHIRKFVDNNQNKSMFYVEVPAINRNSLKWLKRQLTRKDIKSLERNGSVKKDVAEKLFAIWK